MRGPARAVLLAGAALLALSLFLPWSHQLSAGFLARFGGNPALRGVPLNPDAWQLFTFADALLALLAAAVAGAAVAGRAATLPWLAIPLALAAAFTLHAVAVPPTSGVDIFDPVRQAYARVSPGAGPGETVALIGLALAAAPILGSSVRRPR